MEFFNTIYLEYWKEATIILCLVPLIIFLLWAFILKPRNIVKKGSTLEKVIVMGTVDLIFIYFIMYAYFNLLK